MKTSDSSIVRVLTSVVTHLRAAAADATVTKMGTTARESLTVPAGDSATFRITRWSRHAVCTSWLYHWLTADPEPEPVVIDLRETWTVGPLLVGIDRCVRMYRRYERGSRLRRFAGSLHESARARPVQLASTAALAALLTDLVLRVVLGSPSTYVVGVELILIAIALAGTRVRASADEIAGSTLTECLEDVLTPPDPPRTDDVDE